MIRERGRLSPDEAAPLLQQVAHALAAAHAAGIVHRDVKPSNILVGRNGQVKLTDFGIARVSADPTLTQTGLVTGSPSYLAPEVASGQRGDEAVDVWSFGCDGLPRPVGLARRTPWATTCSAGSTASSTRIRRACPTPAGWLRCSRRPWSKTPRGGGRCNRSATSSPTPRARPRHWRRPARRGADGSSPSSGSLWWWWPPWSCSSCCPTRSRPSRARRVAPPTVPGRARPEPAPAERWHQPRRRAEWRISSATTWPRCRPTRTPRGRC